MEGSLKKENLSLAKIRSSTRKGGGRRSAKGGKLVFLLGPPRGWHKKQISPGLPRGEVVAKDLRKNSSGGPKVRSEGRGRSQKEKSSKELTKDIETKEGRVRETRPMGVR